MFLSDKYIPLSLSDSIINKKITSKLSNFTKDTLTNIIFYGINGTGKYILSFLLLRSIFFAQQKQEKNNNSKKNLF